MPAALPFPAEVVHPGRLRLARQLAGITRVELAATCEVSPATVQALEAGALDVGAALRSRLALALGVTPAFLGRDLVHSADYSGAHFRARIAAPRVVRESAAARIAVLAEVVEELDEHVELPAVEVPAVPAVAESTSPAEIEAIAAVVRHHWGLAAGPAPHVVATVEAKGIVVARESGADRRIDACSQWVGGRPYMLLRGSGRDCARSRFDTAHELAHLVLHPDPDSGARWMERQADRFAAAFLMPAADIADELPDVVDWTALKALKRHWGVSIAALLTRCRDLGAISGDAYTRAYRTLSRLGWRSQEPVGLGRAEHPSLLTDALAATGNEEAILSKLALPRRIRELMDGSVRPGVGGVEAGGASARILQAVSACGPPPT